MHPLATTRTFCARSAEKYSLVVGHWEDTLLECTQAKVCHTGRRYRGGRRERTRDCYLNWLRKGTGKFMGRTLPSTGSKSGNSKESSDVKCSDIQRAPRVSGKKQTSHRLLYNKKISEGLPSLCDRDIFYILTDDWFFTLLWNVYIKITFSGSHPHHNNHNTLPFHNFLRSLVVLLVI